MTARTTRRTRALGAVAVTAGALALSLLPATSAQAGPSDPWFSYVDVSGGTDANPVRQLAFDDVLGSTTADPAATNLTDANIQTSTYDVSPDGNTLAVAARTGTPDTIGYDATFGLMVVRRAPDTTVSSKVVSQFWDGNPVLSNNGQTVWWIDGGTLYSADSDTGAATSRGTAFAPAAGEVVSRLAVSADGTKAAVIYRGTSADRVLAASIAAGKTDGNYAEVSYPTATLKPDSSTFVWRGTDQLLFNESDPTAPAPAPLLGASVTLPTTGTAVTGGSTPQPVLNDFYDVKLDATGMWWMWKDVDGKSTAFSQTDDQLLLAVPTTPATDRGNGSSTFRYTPSTNPPPALVTATNAADFHPTFSFSASTVKYNANVYYRSFNLYGGLPGGGYDTSGGSSVTYRAVLQRSFDGVNFTTVGYTTGARFYVVGSLEYNGIVQVRRNVYYRWVSAGDVFTKGFSTSRRFITAVPILSSKVTTSGAYRIVSGAVTRPAGRVYLYRYVSGKYVLVTYTKIVKTGTYAGSYTFPKRSLPRGTYKVVTPADSYMGLGLKVFKF